MKKNLTIASVFIILLVISIIVPKTMKTPEVTLPEIETPDITLDVTPDITIEPQSSSIIDIKTISDQLYSLDNITILVDYTLNIPHPNEYATDEAITNIELYYDNFYSKVVISLNDDIYDTALTDQQNNPTSFLEYTYNTNFDIFLENDDILSIKREEVKFLGGTRESITAYGDVFRKSDGAKILLTDIISDTTVLTEYIKTSISSGQTQGVEYYSNVEELIDEIFDSSKYYLTQTGIIIFFDMYDLAPGSAYVSEFIIPYSSVILNQDYQYLGE